MQARLSAFVIWALVAAGLVFWGYRFWATPLVAPANVTTVGEGPGARGDFTRMFGAAPPDEEDEPAPAVESSRFRLLGVLAPKPPVDEAPASKAGVALIAVDGKPARAYVVGARLDGELVLQSVSRRSASIGAAQGATSVVLELPPPTAPATGSLPRASADGDATRGFVPRPLQQPVRPQPQPQLQAPEPADESDEEEATPPLQRGAAGNPANR